MGDSLDKKKNAGHLHFHEESNQYIKYQGANTF